MTDSPERVEATEVSDLHRLLRQLRATVATAESLTGGRLASLITAVPGASAVYVGGVVSYATRIKVELLGVEQDLVDSAGVISAACAEAMAIGVRTRLGADFGVATTGVAGPERQEGHPVGTVYVGLAGPDGSRAHRLALTGDRLEIAQQACLAALSLLRAELSGLATVRDTDGE